MFTICKVLRNLWETKYKIQCFIKEDDGRKKKKKKENDDEVLYILRHPKKKFKSNIHIFYMKCINLQCIHNSKDKKKKDLYG